MTDPTLRQHLEAIIKLGQDEWPDACSEEIADHAEAALKLLNHSAKARDNYGLTDNLDLILVHDPPVGEA